MKASVTIPLTEWNEAINAKVRSYWNKHFFVFDKFEAAKMTGKRGSLKGNLLSADIMNSITHIVIEVKENALECEITFEPKLQVMNGWDEAHFLLEIECFESLMLHDDPQIEEWKAFREEYKHHTWGGQLSERWREKLYRKDRQILLRATGDVEQETLLRPADSVHQEETDQLMRSVQEDEETNKLS